MGITKLILILLIVQPDGKTLEESIKFEGTFFLPFLATNPREKFALIRNLNQTKLIYTLFIMFLKSSDMHHLQERWAR